MTTTSIEVTNPQARRTVNHRLGLHNIWESPEWIAFRDFHTAGKVCVHCGYAHGEQRRDRQGSPRFDKNGRPIIVKLTVNHISRHKYRTVEEYLTWDDDCEVCCRTCNGMQERGLKICPVCKTKFIFWRETECVECYDLAHPQEAEIRKEAKARQDEINRLTRNEKARKKAAFKAYKNHPCKFRGTEQRCRRRPGARCVYQSRNVAKCPTWKPKEATA